MTNLVISPDYIDISEQGWKLTLARSPEAS